MEDLVGDDLIRSGRRYHLLQPSGIVSPGTFIGAKGLRLEGARRLGGMDQYRPRVQPFCQRCDLHAPRPFYRQCALPRDDGVAADEAVILRDSTVKGFLSFTYFAQVNCREGKPPLARTNPAKRRYFQDSARS